MSKLKTLVGAVACTALLAGATIAQAQPDPGSYPPGYEPGYAYGEADTPPTPEGYSDSDRRYADSARAREEDRRYAEAIDRWAAENCVDQRNENAAAGAIIGGIFGAIIGSQAAGRHDRAAGAFAGGVLGAMAGSAIGASADTPGCPPGYVVRRGAAPFYWSGFYGGYAYAAPPGYRPWIWTGGRWVYRPYPYHRYWYSYERRRGDWDGRRDWRRDRRDDRYGRPGR